MSDFDEEDIFMFDDSDCVKFDDSDDDASNEWPSDSDDDSDDERIEQLIEMPSPPHLVRVLESRGYALHGLAFEFSNGTRRGLFEDNGHNIIPLDDPEAMSARGFNVHEVTHGDYLVAFDGHNCTSGYLCYNLDLHFNSGRTIFLGGQGPDDWKGASFSWAAPVDRPYLVQEICFRHGRFDKVVGSETNVHLLPVTQGNYANMPEQC